MCPEGYSGTLCQEFDDCVTQPCYAGATCLDGQGKSHGLSMISYRSPIRLLRLSVRTREDWSEV